MKIDIQHRLGFGVGSSGQRSVQQLLLTPRSGPTQTVEKWSIAMEGFATAAAFSDAFGNMAHLVSQTKPEGDLTVEVSGIVETHDRHGVLGRLPGDPVSALFKRITPLTLPRAELIEPFERGDKNRIALLHGLMARIGEFYRFGPEQADDGEQTQVQDGQSQSQSQVQSSGGAAIRTEVDAPSFAHLFIGAARALDIPARFVTGYLCADEEEPAAFHAWAEAFDEGLGWIGFDAALGLCPTERHVRVAAGLDELSTTPIRVVPQLGEPRLLAIAVAGVIEAAQ